MCFVVDAVPEKNALLLREDGPHPRLPSEAPELHAMVCTVTAPTAVTATPEARIQGSHCRNKDDAGLARDNPKGGEG